MLGNPISVQLLVSLMIWLVLLILTISALFLVPVKLVMAPVIMILRCGLWVLAVGPKCVDDPNLIVDFLLMVRHLCSCRLGGWRVCCLATWSVILTMT